MSDFLQIFTKISLSFNIKFDQTTEYSDTNYKCYCKTGHLKPVDASNTSVLLGFLMHFLFSIFRICYWLFFIFNLFVFTIQYFFIWLIYYLARKTTKHNQSNASNSKTRETTAEHANNAKKHVKPSKSNTIDENSIGHNTTSWNTNRMTEMSGHEQTWTTKTKRAIKKWFNMKQNRKRNTIN